MYRVWEKKVARAERHWFWPLRAGHGTGTSSVDTPWKEWRELYSLPQIRSRKVYRNVLCAMGGCIHMEPAWPHLCTFSVRWRDENVEAGGEVEPGVRGGTVSSGGWRVTGAASQGGAAVMPFNLQPGGSVLTWSQRVHAGSELVPLGTRSPHQMAFGFLKRVSCLTGVSRLYVTAHPVLRIQDIVLGFTFSQANISTPGLIYEDEFEINGSIFSLGSVALGIVA